MKRLPFAVVAACVLGLVFYALYPSGVDTSVSRHVSTSAPATQDLGQPVSLGASSQPTSQSLRGYTYAGLPKGAEYKLLMNKGYIVGYSERHKDPVWAAYRLFRTDSPYQFRRPSRFAIDERTAARVSHNDYTNSGYDRGHMAPNSAIMSRYGREAQIETFLMSNVCPQQPNLNRGMWEELESREANDYADRFGQVWVIDGPIFDANPRRL